MRPIAAPCLRICRPQHCREPYETVPAVFRSDRGLRLPGYAGSPCRRLRRSLPVYGYRSRLIFCGRNGGALRRYGGQYLCRLSFLLIRPILHQPLPPVQRTLLLPRNISRLRGLCALRGLYRCRGGQVCSGFPKRLGRGQCRVCRCGPLLRFQPLLTRYHQLLAPFNKAFLFGFFPGSGRRLLLRFRFRAALLGTVHLTAFFG